MVELYINEPVLRKALQAYKTTFKINTDVIVKYFQNKKSIRNGKDISDGSKVSQISTFKKALKKIKDTPALNKLKMPNDVMNKVNSDQVANRTKKHQSSKIVVSAESRKKIITGLKGTTFEELYPALLLASGRKPSDLYKGTFKKGKDPNSLIITTELGNTAGSCSFDYSVPLLVSYSLFDKSLKKFRALFPGLNKVAAADVPKKFSKINANAMLELSKKLKVKLISSDLRILYITQLHRRSKDTFDQFLVNVLSKDPVDVSLNYRKISFS